MDTSVPDSSRVPPAPPPGTTTDQLLTPGRTPEDRAHDAADPNFVHLGNLRVAKDVFPEFVEAHKYLAKDPQATAMLYGLEHAPEQYTVQGIHDGNDRFSPRDHTVYWDPKSALLTTEGARQTPALGLLHEEGHLANYVYDRAGYLSRVSTPDARYDTAEEKEVIEKLENPGARILHEGTRSNHGGVAYDVAGPAQTTPLPSPRRTWGAPDVSEKRAAIDHEVLALRAMGVSAPPAVGDGPNAIRTCDDRPHTGSVVHLDGNTVAMHVGKGEYVVYDVQKDLHGVMPPEGNPQISIDGQGIVRDPGVAARHSSVEPAPQGASR